MSKKLGNLKWQSVAVEGFPVSMSDKFLGFVALEECTTYGLDKQPKGKRKQKQKNKRKSEQSTSDIPMKKIKLNNQVKLKEKSVRLSNGFLVESFESVTPSLSNEKFESREILKNNLKVTNQKSNVSKKSGDANKKKTKLGEDIAQTTSELIPEDMLTWAEFKLPESILKALMELGFKKPTKIQELTLPAAIHGRRDILGAAETGSGKTLAFGLPILTGIIKLKEKAELGFDAYKLPYKKTSAKKRKPQPEQIKKGKNKKVSNQYKKKNIEHKAKESSEDGYGSDDESDDVDENKAKNNIVMKTTGAKGANKSKVVDDDDYLEEIEVPIRRKEPSVDEGNDSDDSSNYTHLSEMLDSDDLADSSSDEDAEANGEVKEGEDSDSLVSGDELEDEPNLDEGLEESEEDIRENETEIDENFDEEQGIGCVKVIDDVELPGHVMVKTGKPLYALILTPTRELAIQISRHLIAIAKYTGIKVATIVGGMASVKQERVLRGGPEVVVATPGRLWELSQRIPHLQQLHSVRFLAIDETDRMVERGHFEELQPLLERLNVDEEVKNTRQNFVFSATLTMVHDLPVHMRGKKVTKRGKIINRKIKKMTPQQKVQRLIDLVGMTSPKVVDITTQNLGTAETLTESRITCALEHKDAYLYYILKRHPGRTIVFCNSIGSVKRLAQLLPLLKCVPLPLHASMPQRQRLKNLERFRDDPQGILVATDVAARGLDIPGVEHVIHYQVPRTAENYVHRSGRTARANKEGLTILMMDPSEAYLYGKLCRTLNKTSELPSFPVSPETIPSLKELVSRARDLLALSARQQRAAAANGWRAKAAKEMDIIIDDDNIPVKQLDPSIDKELKVKKRQLESMLTRPLFPRGFSFKYPTLNEPTALVNVEENALEVMKKSLATGELKKEKRKGKNSSLLKLNKNDIVK